MFCSKCGTAIHEGIRFCRTCGQDTSLCRAQVLDKDPDEITGKGIRDVIIGDGFLIVAIILGISTSAVSGLLWLALLIPAFYFFGKGFSNVLYAKQIRRRSETDLINTKSVEKYLPPGKESFIEVFRKSVSGDLIEVPSVTERTTKSLDKRTF